MRKRILLFLGTASFIAGTFLLAIGAYGYFDQQDAAQRSAASIEVPEFPTIEGVNRAPVPYDQLNLPVSVYYYNPPVPPPSLAASPVQISIERLGLTASVVEMGLDGAGVPQVPLNGGDVAWYNFSAAPGNGSNAVFAGHVNWERAAGVFERLNELQAGDRVRLVSADGRQLVYDVYKNFAVDPADPTSLTVMAPSKEDIVTLITCGGTWVPDRSKQFGGDYTNRVIVQARLVNATAPSAGPAAAGG